MTEKYQRYLAYLNSIFGVDIELLHQWRNSCGVMVDLKKSLRQILGSYEARPENNRKVLEALYRRAQRDVRQLNAQAGTHDETDAGLKEAHKKFIQHHQEHLRKYWPELVAGEGLEPSRTLSGATGF